MSDDRRAADISRAELISLHQMQARLHALVEEMALPRLEMLISQASRIEDAQATAAGKLDVFIKHEFEPVKKEAAKLPAMQDAIDKLGDDLDVLRHSFQASEELRARHAQEIRVLQDRDQQLARTAEHAQAMRAGEKQLAKKIIWLASGFAGAVGFVAQRWGADVLQFLKGLL